MGRTSKKKKKRGGSGRRGQLKDHGSNDDEDNELLSEEITALSAIFQEDCKVVSGSRSPPQIAIKIRPYSKDMGYEDIDISAMLLVKCLPGYPYKCPKLQITPEQGLTTADAEKLLSLLEDQANSNAREGRVMIFNLVEAAQEFLSEIIPENHDEETVPCLTAHRSAQFIEQAMLSNKAKSCSGGPFVYGFIDLFSGLEDSRNWSLTPDENRGIVSAVQSHPLDTSRIFHEKPDKNLKGFEDHAKEEVALPSPMSKLSTLQEDNVDDTSISSSDTSKSTDDVESGFIQNEKKQKSSLQDDAAEDDNSNSESESSGSWSSVSLAQDQVPQINKKDLLMVHLIRVACSSRGPLADALPQITDELHQLGILSEEVLDLASKSSPDFNKTFEHVFNQNMEEEEKEEEELTRIKDVKGGEEDKALQEMTIPTASEAQEQARARVLEQQDDLCKLSRALGVLASASSVCREREEFLRLVKKEMEFYNTMVEREDVDGEKAAVNAYKAAREDTDQAEEVAEADEVSSALMEKVDGLIQNLEKEIDDVDIKIGKGWQVLDRDRDGKVTPDEVAAAAMYLKDTLAKEGLQQLISSLSKDKEGRIMVEDIVRLGRLGSKPEENATEEESN